MSRKSYLILTVSALALSQGVALAQDAPARAAAANGEEVVVTAQKRSERQVNVPASVTALSSNDLAQAGVTSVASLSQVVPGFRMDLAGAHVQPSIRGVGSPIAGIGLPANIASYIDGFYRPNAVTNNVEFNDVRSVEVLKGPQGTLFGRNATGGAIMITTRSPSFEPEADVKLRYGNHNDIRTNLYATAGITDTLAGSISVYTRDSNGYLHNIVTDRRQGDVSIRSVRGKLLFEPSESASFELTLEYNQTHDNSVFSFPNYRGWANASLIPGTIVTSRPRQVSQDYEPAFRSNAYGAFLKASVDLGWGTLTSYTGYQFQQNESRYDVDGTSAVISHVWFPQSQKAFTQEFDVAYKSDRFDVVGGLFYMNDSGLQLFRVDSLSPPVNFLRANVLTNSVAAFADGTYRVTDKLFLTVGLRYGIDHVDVRQIVIPAGNLTLTNDASFYSLTPRVVLRYQLTEDSNLYASFSQGTKSGGFNATGDVSRKVNPEKINAFEVGYKYGGGAWRFETAAYYYDYKDLQFSSYDGPSTNLINAASASIYGAEAHLVGDLTDELRLDVGANYTHAEYDSFPGAPHQVWDPATGVVIFPDDAAGHPMIRSPKFSGNVNLTYTKAFEHGTLELIGAFSYQTKVDHDPFGVTNQPAVGVLNLKASWLAPDDSWSVSIYGNNVTDEEYITSTVLQGVGFQATYAPPALVGVEVAFGL